MSHEYWRKKLNVSEKKLYDDMLVAFFRYEECVSCGNLPIDSINKVYDAVCSDHPELFYLPSNYRVEHTMDFGCATSNLILKNLFTIDQIGKFNGCIKSILNDLSLKLNSISSLVEKEKIICQYLLQNTTYEINHFYNQNIAIVLCNHKGQCSGISSATKFLLDYFGINTIIVKGNLSSTNGGVGGAHAWNIVEIDGEYFHLDVTCMLGLNLKQINADNTAYFNYSDDEITKYHSWNSKLVPKCHHSTRITTNNVVNQSCEIVVSSLYEFRSYLKSAIMQSKPVFKCKVLFQFSIDKVMTMIKKSCQDVITSLNQNIMVSIDINDNLVTIVIQY